MSIRQIKLQIYSSRIPVYNPDTQHIKGMEDLQNQPARQIADNQDVTNNGWKIITQTPEYEQLTTYTEAATFLIYNHYLKF